MIKTEKNKTPIVDYRGNCWEGYGDVSLRLSQLQSGERFTFICTPEQVSNMTKIIDIRNGYIEEKRNERDGIIILVSKKVTWQPDKKISFFKILISPKKFQIQDAANRC